MINLRDGAIAGLAAGEYAGVIAKHYDADGNDGALVFNRSGEARVGDYTVNNVTVYSSDGIAFYTDAEMTEPATIPAGVTPTLVSGTEYTYTAITDDTEPLLTRDEIANMTDKAIAVWDAAAKKVKAGPVPTVANKVLISQADGSFVWGDYTAGSDMIEASSVTITGRALISGVIIRVMFMSDLAGVDTSTGLVINYNSVNYNVKVAKDGSLVNFVASDLGGSPTVYKYLQAYTAFELLFDGTQFIIVGNPVVLSGSGFKVYADGSKLVDEVTLNNMQSVTSNAVARAVNWVLLTDRDNSGAFTIPDSAKEVSITIWDGASSYLIRGNIRFEMVAIQNATNLTAPASNDGSSRWTITNNGKTFTHSGGYKCVTVYYK